MVCISWSHCPCETKVRTLFRVRRDLVKFFLLWLKNNNHLYKDTIISGELLNELPENDIPENIRSHFEYIEINETTNVPYDNIDRDNEQLDDLFTFKTTGLLDSAERLELEEIDQIEILKDICNEKRNDKLADTSDLFTNN